MDRLASMSVLLAVVDSGSFSGAGRQLRMPVPTVSRKISELEAHLKATLLLRSTRRLELTDAGRAYIVACKRILEEIAEAERNASGEYTAPRGDLLVTAPIVFGRLHVVPIVAEFLRAYPDVDVRLVLSDRSLDFFEEHLDVAVRIGELPDSSLKAVRLGNVRRVVCAGPLYLEQHGTPTVPMELTAHHCITFETLSQPETWVFSSAGRAAPIRVHSRLVVNTAEAAIGAAVANVGLTRVLSYQIAEHLKARELALALQKFEPEPLPVSLVHTGERVQTLKLRAFIDFAAPRLKMRLAAERRRS